MRIERIASLALLAAVATACTTTAPQLSTSIAASSAEDSSSDFWQWEQTTRDRTDRLTEQAARLAAKGEHAQALACLDAAIGDVLSTPEDYEGGQAHLDFLADLIAEARSVEEEMLRRAAIEALPSPAQQPKTRQTRHQESLIPASDLPLVLNSRVGRFLEASTKSGDFHRRVEKGLERAGVYLPMIRSKLANAGLPQDLAYLPIIESSFSLTAHSRAGAHGMWQFMPATARQYGLRVSSHLDERRDPIRSTNAAVKHLGRLHDEFGDWLLALAAYNSGSGRVRRAVQRANSRDFWRIRPYLPRETRNYVPSFIAAVIVSKRPERYGFEPIVERQWDIDSAPRRSRRVVERRVSPDGSYTVRRHDTLWDIARSFDLDLDDLCTHNGLHRNAVIRPGQALAVPARGTSRSPGTATRYRVRPGDTLFDIARRFGVSVPALCDANGIQSSEIYPGDLLRIPAVRAKG